MDNGDETRRGGATILRQGVGAVIRIGSREILQLQSEEGGIRQLKGQEEQRRVTHTKAGYAVCKISTSQYLIF